MKKRTYAREITKDYLKSLGVEHVAEDGLSIIVNGEQRNLRESYSGKRLYYNVMFHDPAAWAATPKEERTNTTGRVTLGMHVINFVWNNQDKPQGLVVDHIDNNSTNNHISNLQLSTYKENVTKDRNKPPRVVRMPKYITLEKIESKLAYYNDLYEKAKAEHDSEAAHKIRTSLSDWNAKKRQYLECPEKYQRPEKPIKPPKAPKLEPVVNECHARAQKKRDLKYEINRAHRLYQQLLEAYGKDDPIVYQYWGEWKMAIVNYKMFCNETKRARSMNC